MIFAYNRLLASRACWIVRLPARESYLFACSVSATMCIHWWWKTKIEPFHDDVIKWKHLPRYWSFARGIHRSPVNSPHKRQWRGALMLSLICARINGWVNNHEAGDLRRHRTQYDVSVMRCWEWNVPGEMGQYHGCWCFKSMLPEVIRSHVFDNVGQTLGQTYPCLHVD